MSFWIWDSIEVFFSVYDRYEKMGSNSSAPAPPSIDCYRQADALTNYNRTGGVSIPDCQAHAKKVGAGEAYLSLDRTVCVPYKKEKVNSSSCPVGTFDRQNMDVRETQYNRRDRINL